MISYKPDNVVSGPSRATVCLPLVPSQEVSNRNKAFRETKDLILA